LSCTVDYMSVDVFHSELEKSNTGCPVSDDALKQFTTILEEMKAASPSGSVVFSSLTLACSMLTFLSSFWSSAGSDSVGFSSSVNVVPSDTVVESIQSLLAMLKVSGENAQVTLAEI